MTISSSSQFRGGLRWGQTFFFSYNLSYPLAVLVISDEWITLKALFKPVDIQKAEVGKVSLAKGWFSKGLRIEHTKRDAPPFIIFWTWKPEEVLNSFAAHGYKVEANLR